MIPLLWLLVLAQTPAFEVASVKPVSADDQASQPIGLFTYPGGRIHATNYTLRLLIHDAYAVELHQILGGPSWINDDPFEVEAKAPAGSAAAAFVPANAKSRPSPELREMLQTLLADRFHLKLHRETRPAPVYSLVVAKGGPKLSYPKNPSAEPFVGAGRTGAPTGPPLSLTFTGQNATIDQLVVRLSQHFGRPVKNRTGLTGSYDFTIEYAPTDAPDHPVPPLVRAIQDQAGLKLDTEPGTIEVLVVESAARPASN